VSIAPNNDLIEPLTSDWLRERFSSAAAGLGPRRAAIGPSAENEWLLTSTTSFIPAAVLLPLVLREKGLTVLFTQRTDHLYDHAGQVSFPGGRCEKEDESPVFTALRETEEEIGLSRKHVEVLGLLPEYRTGSGFSITPVVGLISPPFELSLDHFEVAEVFETPLEFLLNPSNHQRHSSEISGKLRHYYAMPYQGYNIWGATASIVVSFYHHLYATTTVD